MMSGRRDRGFIRKKAWESPGPKVDPFSRLPAEMIQFLTDYLCVRDVLRWLRVCKSWNQMLHHPAMSAFWRRASVHAGLPDYYVQNHFPECSKADDLFHQARLYTNHISRIRPETKLLRGTHPFESSSKCEYAGQGYFVKTVDYQSLEEEETAIGELCPDRRIIQKISSFRGKYGEVNYASICANHVIWQTLQGCWFRYNLKEDEFSRLFPKQIKKQMGDSIGHCRHCLFMLIANIESVMHGYNWVLNFVKIEGNKVIEATHKPHIPPGITQFIPRPVKVHLVSNDGCKTHRLIIQGGTGACIFEINHHENTQENLRRGESAEGKQITISPKPIATLNPFFDSEIAVMVVTTTSEMTLSQDESLIGIVTSIVYPHASGLCLHVFDLRTNERISSVKVKWAEGFNDASILAISRLYAVMGVGHSNGTVKIVHCRSGKVVSSHSPLSRGLPPVIPMAKLMLVHMQGTYGDECLTDVKGKFNVAVLYRKGVGNIEAIFYDPFPPSLALLEDSNGLDSDSDNEADDDQSNC